MGKDKIADTAGEQQEGAAALAAAVAKSPPSARRDSTSKAIHAYGVEECVENASRKGRHAVAVIAHTVRGEAMRIIFLS